MASIYEAMRTARERAKEVKRFTVYQRWDDDTFYAAGTIREREDERIGYWEQTGPNEVCFVRLRRFNSPMPIFDRYPSIPMR